MASHANNSDAVEKAVGDPASLYGIPANVLSDDHLSTEQKRVILESWALDQKRLMESEDENMPQMRKGRPSAATLYQDIITAQKSLPH